MIAIITGDIINSRKADAALWMKVLKGSLNTFGRSPKVWEIYRGDSFQLAIQDPEKVLQALIILKSALKSIKGLDVRMAAGIGTISFSAAKITESQGSAFQLSGQQFDRLQEEKKTMLIKTPWEAWNQTIDVTLSLALTIMDNWSPGAAAVVHEMYQHPNLSQQELGQRLGIGQSSVSERQGRAYIQEIQQLENYFRQQTAQLIAG